MYQEAEALAKLVDEKQKEAQIAVNDLSKNAGKDAENGGNYWRFC